MILGAHVILYSADADADRAFLRDLLDGEPPSTRAAAAAVLQLPPAEVAVHPGETSVPPSSTSSATTSTPRSPEWGARGIAFDGPVSDQRWGRVTAVRLPGGGRAGLYQARHPTAFDR